MRETPSISSLSYSNTVSAGGDEALFERQVWRAMMPAANNVDKPRSNIDMGTRIVKVFVADIADDLPLKDRILYQGEETLTDLTDGELFFQLPVQDLLDKHNTLRALTKDKEQSRTFGRDVMLEPVKVRDLRMVVLSIAVFGT